MEIAEILNIVFGGTTLCGVIAAIVYRRQNKRIKESEAKQAESTATVSDIEAQRAKIDLGDLYQQKVLEMMELINIKQDKGNVNQDKMMQMLSNIDARVDNLEARVGKIEGCLDGELTQRIADKQMGQNAPSGFRESKIK
jgi:Trp operon repressor